MKRTFVILLAISLVFCGCQAFDLQQTTTSHTGTKVSNLQADVSINISKTADSYEAYVELLKTITIPYKFVHYDDLRHFGEFKSFMIHDHPRFEEGHRYIYYCFDDGTGMKPTLVIKSEMGSYTPYGALSDEDVQLSDMRHSKVAGTYEFHGLHYQYYSDGRLKLILWMDEDTTYVLDCIEGLSNYPYNCETLMSALLNLEGKTADDVWAIISGKTE